MDRSRYPARSIPPAFRLWDCESAFMRMLLKLSQPWEHRLAFRGCEWLAVARSSWDVERAMRRSCSSRRLRPMPERPRTQVLDRGFLRACLLGGSGPTVEDLLESDFFGELFEDFLEDVPFDPEP